MNSKELVFEAARATFRRLARNALTILALALGTGTIVVVLAISQSSASQIAGRLDAMSDSGTQVMLNQTAWLLSDQEIQQRAQLAGPVEAIGTFQPLASNITPPVSTLLADKAVNATVLIATEEGLNARGATILSGTITPEGLGSSGARTASLGEALARQLNLTLENGATTVRFGGSILTVTAIVRDNSRESSLANAIVLGPETARAAGVLPDTQQLIAISDLSIEDLAAALPFLLSPEAPTSVSVSASASADQLRGEISSDTKNLVLVVALTTAVMSGIGILTTMQIAVRERRSEIGILRAMGMTRSAVAWKFLLESLFVGVLGAVVGWVLGILIAAATVSVTNSPFVAPPIIFVVPALGLVVGAIGGLIPAVRSAQLEPLTLIRAQS